MPEEFHCLWATSRFWFPWCISAFLCRHAKPRRVRALSFSTPFAASLRLLASGTPRACRMLYFLILLPRRRQCQSVHDEDLRIVKNFLGAVAHQSTRIFLEIFYQHIMLRHQYDYDNRLFQNISCNTRYDVFIKRVYKWSNTFARNCVYIKQKIKNFNFKRTGSASTIFPFHSDERKCWRTQSGATVHRNKTWLQLINIKLRIYMRNERTCINCKLK